MRVLAIDHGSKRMGIAIAEKNVELMVIGMPRNMDGSYGPAAQKVKEFVEVLKPALGLPIKFWDERLTSAQANRLLIQADVRRSERKEVVDKMAAAILLQSYLDSVG
jgi:putative Holliday junction resolvase